MAQRSSHRIVGGHSFMDYQDVTLTAGHIIPQTVYPAPQPYSQLPHVRFTVRGELGVRLVDALNSTFSGLGNADDVPCMSGNAKKITLRLQWPGYPPWSDIVHLYDHTYNVNPNTVKKVAQLVAQKIQMFWNDLQNQPYNASSASVDGWQLNRFRFEDLVLVELRHVSQGSWQPVLAATL